MRAVKRSQAPPESRSGNSREVGAELERRFLAPRQERRIGEAIAAADKEFTKEARAGRRVREDGFFDAPNADRGSPAEEILEGVLRTAAQEWEERKVPYIGRIFATVSFDSSVTPSDASYLLKLADRLTYQQIVLLAFWRAARDENRPYQREVMSAAVRVAEGRSRPTATILAEINDLAATGLLGLVSAEGEAGVAPGGVIEGLTAFGTFGGGTNLTSVTLTDMGARLHRLMGLDQVPDADLEEIAKALHGLSR
jgi:hypothetical protein